MTSVSGRIEITMKSFFEPKTGESNQQFVIRMLDYYAAGIELGATYKTSDGMARVVNVLVKAVGSSND